ncbi:MAG: hypothetical protein COX80_00520 [Candidatus Magasanikbacteria bacterium CG_4_10_14_0_2_um_filter_33_14]|uniref:ASCH domain-containing protein n=1 Tax=Candidatus Magasanikbacteria bacterium CG_4_10_14_0_2_um_filter_33_14 TaxID=1974636 RepID=A0A2M7VBX0_9BACT|nr:MAG: hypothetical protein COX80_00520 [Candidatus Magasanikbacteria bacterium CG_4_10_14_0_2_um_filter_33_14]
MYLYHTTFKNEIVAEFLPPKNLTSKKVIILCDGLPSMPDKNKLVKFLAKKNYWVFHMRYRGTWESSGEFLVNSPVQDVLDIIDELSKGFSEVWGGQEFKVDPESVFVMGASFGGTTALMSSLDSRIKKVVAICPLVDWKDESGEESNDYLKNILRQGYPGSYRFSKENWDKLVKTDFFNPIDYADKFDSSKILSIHAKDDKIVMYEGVKNFMDKLGCIFLTRKKGGHLSSSIIMKYFIFRKIKKFLDNLKNMIQSMRLPEEIFEKIKSGQKTIETRLLDEKRKVLSVGDIIEFAKRPTLHEKMQVKILDLTTYKTFEEVYDNCDLKDLGYDEKMTKEEYLEKVHHHYDKEEIKDYEILAIKMEIILK